MKVLVVYFSQTGNTEKIALSIYKEVSQHSDASLHKLEEVDPDSLKTYDLLFIGSPIHAGSVVKEVKDFLKQMPQLPGLKMAGFITHAATVYPQQTYDQMAQPLVEACGEKQMEYAGCFSCQGYLADFMHEAVQKMQNVDDEEWQRRVQQMTGHPNAEDEAKAIAFAKALL